MTEKEFNEIKQELKAHLLERAKSNRKAAQRWWQYYQDEKSEYHENADRISGEYEECVWEDLAIMLDLGLITSIEETHNEIREELGSQYYPKKGVNNEHSSSN